MIATVIAWFKGASLVWRLAPFIALALLSVAGYVLWLRAENAGLERDLLAAERDAAIYGEVQRRTAESFERYVDQVERDRADVVAESARARNRAVALDRLEREIRNGEGGAAPAGALADSVLDRLRELTAAGD